MSIRDGIITEIGTGPAAVPAARTINAPRQTAHARFVDAHVRDLRRPGGTGLRYQRGRNARRGTADDPDYVADTTTDPANDWVIGGGWSMSHFPGGDPSADILDEACPDRPAILLSADHHSAWVNTKAMAAAGLDETSTAPAGGVIITDSTGRPTGCLHESAIDLVSAHGPAAADEEVLAGLREGQRYLNSLGVTAWMDAIVGDYGGHRDPYGTYVGAADSGDLHSEVVGSLWWPRGVEDIDAEVAD